MARAIHVLALAAALAASVVGVHGAAPFRDDAGSGGDAGDTPQEALPLQEAGAYQGNLSTPADADWYRLDRSQTATCMEATIDGRSVANATLAAERPGATLPLDEAPSAEATHNPTESLTLGLASPDVQRVLLGLTPQYTLTHPAAPDAGFGGYGFDLQVTTIADVAGDRRGPPGDVPAADAAGDLPRVSSSCVAGTLDADGGSGGDVDAYKLQADAGDRLVLSLATDAAPSESTTLDLVTPSGKTALTLENGDVVGTRLEETGNYTLSVEDGLDQKVEYGFGITTDDDGPPSCRPSCAETGMT